MSRHDHDDAAGPRAFATLRIMGDDLEPATISETLGLEPSHAHRRGDLRQVGTPYRSGQWSLSSEHRISSANLTEHLSYLLQILGPVEPQLTSILADAAIRADVFCFLGVSGFGGGPVLSVDVMDRFSAMGIPVGLDVYSLSGDEWSGQSAREMRDRLVRRLNAAIRRPGMFDRSSIQTTLVDLAWIEKRGRELVREGERLVARECWSATGAAGAVERITGSLDSKHAGATLMADVAFQLGWLDSDQTLDPPDYWKLRNAADEVVGRVETLDDVEQTFGSPSLSIATAKGGALGYIGPSPKHPIVWFYAGRNGRSLAGVRRPDEPLSSAFTFRAWVERHPRTSGPLRLPPNPFEHLLGG